MEELENKPTRWLVSWNPIKTGDWNLDDQFYGCDETPWIFTPNMKSAKVGDIVYIYASAPQMAIRYKCEITQVGCPRGSLPEGPYYHWDGENPNEPVFVFRMIQGYSTDYMPLSKMREFGIKSESLVGPHKLKVDEKEGVRQMVDLLDHVPVPDIEPNIILYGPPGTGKTYHAAIYADALVGTAADGGKEEFEDALSFWKQKNYDEVLSVFNGLKEEGCIATITFHQSFGYEDFIEGIKPSVRDGKVIYEVKPGLFKQACYEARRVSDYPYVFVIDEINRGNISKIFGELITLLEKSKRGGAEEEMRVILPYSGEIFSVPKNVFIIGTMNTADRSIALMDTALRRRFHFVEMMPDTNLLKDVIVEENGVKVNVGDMLDTINRRIEVLYDREHTIGHSYFMKLKKNPSLTVLADIFRGNIIPLLQEYFYGDYSRIQLVLGDNGKSKTEYQFVKNVPLKPKQLFKGNIDLDLPEQEYQLQDIAFLLI